MTTPLSVPPSASSVFFEGAAMGSPLRLTIGGPAFAELSGRAAVAWEEVADEFAEGDEAMSRFRDSSELTALNRLAGSGGWLVVSARLRHALAAAERARRITDGRFEPRVLGALERIGYAGAPLGELRREPAHPDRCPSVSLDRLRGVAVDVPIDLGGIGKGLALRWAAARLDRMVEEAGTDWSRNWALLDAGGDLVVRGPAPDEGPWRIAIEDPSGRPSPVAVIGIASGAVATSSVRRNRWMADGRDVHHLIDPDTGEPAETGLAAVTVAAADPAWSEVWSKTLFLIGRDRVADVARGRDIAAWWIDAGGCVEMTPAARLRTIWLAHEA